MLVAVRDALAHDPRLALPRGPEYVPHGVALALLGKTRLTAPLAVR
jgi:hypothetical protein